MTESRLTWLVALAVVALILFAFKVDHAAADAGQLRNVQPATYVQADSLLREAVQVAGLRWFKQGRRLSCEPSVFVYDETVRGVVSRADEASCSVYFSRALRDRTWSMYTDPSYGAGVRRSVLVTLGSLGVHELGHLLGFEHSDRGAMRAVCAFRSPTVVAWANRKVTR